MFNKIIPLEQGSQEWLLYRKSKIGASDAPIIMKENPWKSPFDLWKQKLDFSLSNERNIAMQRGIDLEPFARETLAKELNIDFDPIVLEVCHLPYMFASLDGINKEQTVIAEIKCPMKGLHLSIPSYYKAQLQHQMYVANVDVCFYYSFDGKNGKIIEEKRDSDYIAKILENEKCFYDNMINFESPELIEIDYKDMSNNFEWKKAVDEWKTVKNQTKIIAELEKKAKDRLIQLSGQSNAKGMGIRLSKIMRKGSIQYDQIPALKEINLNEYRKLSSESFRITDI